MPPPTLRIDKLLWYLRFARSRSLAAALAEAGHIRLDGRRVTRAATTVAAGQMLVLPLGEAVAVIRLLALPQRRGPAPAARACYERLDGQPPPPPPESGLPLPPSIDAPHSPGIGGKRAQRPDDSAPPKGAFRP